MKRIAYLLFAVTLLSGCGQFRFLATSQTQPIGGVQTKNRYRLFQFCVNENGKYVNLDSQEFASAWQAFKSTAPGVFADNGKPMAVYLDYTDGRDHQYGWTILFPYLLTCGIFPMWDHNEWTSHYSIRFKHPKKVPGGLHNTYTVKMERDWNMSCYGPIAMCIPFGTPVADENGQPFSRKQVHFLEAVDTAANNVIAHSAIAYGAACALRRLEEDGTLPDVWDGEDVAEETGAKAPVEVKAPVDAKAPSEVKAPSDGNRPGTGAGGSSVVEIDSIPL